MLLLAAASFVLLWSYLWALAGYHAYLERALLRLLVLAWRRPRATPPTEVTMASDLVIPIVTALQPVYDVVVPAMSVARAASAAGAADVAPAGGLDIAVVGGIAAVVAGVLVLIIHRRRGK